MASLGQSLRQHRIKISLWIAVVEGILVLVHVIPHWAVYVLAAVAIVFWVGAARRYSSPVARQAGWIFAASQLLTVLVPAVWFIAKTVAIIAIALIAVAGLVFLFTEREHTDHA